MLNQIVIMGRLTKDPELRTAGDTPVCSMRIACDRDFKDKNGEKETDFVDVVVWRKLAESVAKYFTKGRMAVVSGRLQIRPWTDKNGEKRYSTEIVAEHIYFGDSKPKAEGGSNNTAPTAGINYGGPSGYENYGGSNGSGGAYMPDDFVPNFDDSGDELPF